MRNAGGGSAHLEAVELDGDGLLLLPTPVQLQPCLTHLVIIHHNIIIFRYKKTRKKSYRTMYEGI